MPNWNRIGLYQAAGNLARIAHAGLSFDGKHCFIAGEDDYPFLVWDIEHEKVIWVANEFRKRHSELSDYIEDKHILVGDTGAEGRYRIFGIDNDYSLRHSEQLG